MTNLRLLGLVSTALVLASCGSSTSSFSAHDGAVDLHVGTGGVGASGTGGGVATGGNDGTGGVPGSGGLGAGGNGGLATGGSSGGGTAVNDASARDSAKDIAVADSAVDASDGSAGCGVGYPAGSSRPLGDGCNICYCQASGIWMCTTAQCPTDAPVVADAPADAGQCPAGQMWCPGCTPGEGSCGVACTGMVCPAPDAAVAEDAAFSDSATADASTVACSQLTLQTDCEIRADCHAVFVDPGTCGCFGSGCCAHFDRCADGGKAVCVAPTTFACTIATWFCESPYVISYTDSCYEGCVLGSVCAP